MSDQRATSTSHGGSTSRIVCARATADGGEQLFTMRPDGSDLRQLTGDPAQGDNWAPAWSPDGARLCFTSNRTGHVCLWLMRPDGSDQQQLTRHPGAEDYEPTWSPDSAAIVFSRGDHQADDLWTVELACGEAHPLTNEQRLDASPAWSPDGRWIVFRRALGSPAGLYVVLATGGEARFLACGAHASWAPDGQRLAFVHGASLWLLPVGADGRPSGGAQPLVASAEMQIGDSSWAPDGAVLAFEARITDAGGTRERLMIVDAMGGEPRDLGPGSQPSWSPWLR